MYLHEYQFLCRYHKYLSDNYEKKFPFYLIYQETIIQKAKTNLKQKIVDQQRKKYQCGIMCFIFIAAKIIQNRVLKQGIKIDYCQIYEQNKYL